MINSEDIQLHITDFGGKYQVKLYKTGDFTSIITLVDCTTEEEAQFVKERWERWFVMWNKVQDKYNELSNDGLDSLEAMDNAWWIHGQSKDGETCG